MHCTLLIAESHHCTRLLGSFEIPLVTCAESCQCLRFGVFAFGVVGLNNGLRLLSRLIQASLVVTDAINKMYNLPIAMTS